MTRLSRNDWTKSRAEEQRVQLDDYLAQCQAALLSEHRRTAPGKRDCDEKYSDNMEYCAHIVGMIKDDLEHKMRQGTYFAFKSSDIGL